MIINNMNKVLESIKPVVENSEQVRIKKERIKKISKEFNFNKVKHWLDDFVFLKKLEKNQIFNFIFALDSLNFCFWGNPKWTIEYKDKKCDGSFGLLMAFQKASENGFPIFEAKYLANISREDLEKIFEGNIKIPLFKERLKILQEIGNILAEKYNGNFKNIIQNANKDTLKLLDLIITDFPSFNDFALYNGKEVYFYKKAQLVINDIYRIFKNQEFSNFKNINQFTASADYKIPQVLRKLEILEYSPELASKVDNKIPIPQGDKGEIEIRANMIWAIELIRNEVKDKNQDITARDIDSYLWFRGQEKSSTDKPYHLTRTIFY